MSSPSNRAPEPVGTPQSVRVQIYRHGLQEEKGSQPLASFRLRSNSNATFADLAASVIERYERSQQGGGHRPEISEALDEKDCAFDMADAIDIIEPNEFVRFILAEPPNADQNPSASQSVGQTGPNSGAPLIRPAMPPPVKTLVGHSGAHIQERVVPDSQEESQLFPSVKTEYRNRDLIDVGATGTIHAKASVRHTFRMVVGVVPLLTCTC